MTRVVRIGVCVLLFVAGAGCKKTELTPEDRAAKDAAPAESASASADAGASAEGGAGKAATGSASSYAGKYTVTAGSMYVPENKDWASVKFKNDETKMLGEGELTIS